jgi:hypothetical protein
MEEKTQINYSLNGGILPSIELTINYSRRIADGYEKVIPELKNDHLTSVTSKNFYVKEFDDTTIKSDKVQLNGLNNLWLNTKTKQMTI